MSDTAYKTWEEILDGIENTPWHMKKFYAAKRGIAKIRRTPRKIKWFVQRGKRGWADCDTWSFDNYISRVNMEALTYLRDNRNGYPNDMTNEEWGGKLDIMIDGFKSAMTNIDIMNYVDEPTWRERDIVRVKGMEEYLFWFHNLWD